MRKECVTVNPDGSYTVKGGGWFWVKLSKTGVVMEMAKGMAFRKSSDLFVKEARLTIQKHFPEFKDEKPA